MAPRYVARRLRSGGERRPLSPSHSTGQFRKGGPTTERFSQLLYDGPDDVSIPDAQCGFRTLKDAEAIGDRNTLREVGLPAERVRLYGEGPAGAPRALTATIKETL